MKTLYLVILKIGFKALDLLSSSASLFTKYKIAVGILILTIKGFDSNAQTDLRRGTCYKIGPRNRKSIDLSISDRISTDNLKDNTIMSRMAYRSKSLSPGISANYSIDSKTVSIGPYFRFYPFQYRRLFLYFIESNYQFSIGTDNEFNVTSGFVFYHESRSISFEFSYQYSTTFSDKKNEFMPIIGVHYFISNRVFKHKNKSEE